VLYYLSFLLIYTTLGGYRERCDTHGYSGVHNGVVWGWAYGQACDKP